MIDRPLQVIHVVWGTGFGGIERFVSDLARFQASAQRMIVGVLACAAPAGDPSLARYLASGVAVTGGGLHSGFDIRSHQLKAMREELAKADIIHMHGFTPPVALEVFLAKRPVIFTEHGLLGLGRRRSPIATVKHKAKGLFLRRCVTAVACVGEWVADAVIQTYRIPRDLVHFVPDGVDFERICSRRTRNEVLLEEGIPSSAWVAVVTARFARFKRIDRLLKAASLMRNDGRGWALLLVGSGPLEDALREQSTSLSLDTHVRFLGYREQVWEIVRAADMVVVPSEREPFGLVVVEAMALGRPVVAFSDSGGPAEIIRKVGGGCLVDTVEDLADLLEKSRAGQHLPSLLPLDQTRLKETYSIATAASAYAKIYAAAVKKA